MKAQKRRACSHVEGAQTHARESGARDRERERERERETCAQRAKVLRGSWHILREKLNHNAPINAPVLAADLQEDPPRVHPLRKPKILFIVS